MIKGLIFLYRYIGVALNENGDCAYSFKMVYRHTHQILWKIKMKKGNKNRVQSMKEMFEQIKINFILLWTDQIYLKKKLLTSVIYNQMYRIFK